MRSNSVLQHNSNRHTLCYAQVTRLHIVSQANLSTNDRSRNWWYVNAIAFFNIYGLWDWGGTNSYKVWQSSIGSKMEKMKRWQCCTSAMCILHGNTPYGSSVCISVCMLNGVRIRYIWFAWLSHKLFEHLRVWHIRVYECVFEWAIGERKRKEKKFKMWMLHVLRFYSNLSHGVCVCRNCLALFLKRRVNTFTN